MSATTNVAVPSRLVLWAETAADLMMPNPMSIRADVTVQEAVAILSDHGYGAAPVIDEAGRPLGVVSRADIFVHHRERAAKPGVAADPERTDRAADGTLVRDIMTPAVFSVEPQTPAAKVLEQLLALKVHRLYVVEGDGTLVGVISAADVLRHLRPEVAAVD